MATYRYISTGFWDDEWIQTLDPSEKLMYLYLMTNPLTNIAGVYQITVRRMCFDTGFNSDTVGHILSKFEKAKKVFYHKGWIILPTWPRYQKIGEKDNNRKGIDAILKSLPDEIFAYIISVGYDYVFLQDIGRETEAPLKAIQSHLEDPSKPLTSPSNYINTNINTNTNTNTNTNINIKEKHKSNTDKKTSQNNRFVRPTLEEVSAYCQERSNGIDPQSFLDFYEAKGWRIGKEPMRDWRAAVRTWERRQMSEGKPLRIFSQTASLDLPEA